MKTFEIVYDRFWDHNKPINHELCLPFEINEVRLQIEYNISKFHPATYWSPAEGGEIEECIVTVIDECYNEEQCETILNSISEEWLAGAVWNHHNKMKNQEMDWN